MSEGGVSVILRSDDYESAYYGLALAAAALAVNKPAVLFLTMGGIRALQGVVALAKQHPVTALEKAAATAKRRGVWRLQDLRRLLTDGETVVQVDFLEAHPLIRPLEAYSLDALSQA